MWLRGQMATLTRPGKQLKHWGRTAERSLKNETTSNSMQEKPSSLINWLILWKYHYFKPDWGHKVWKVSHSFTSFNHSWSYSFQTWPLPLRNNQSCLFVASSPISSWLPRRQLWLPEHVAMKRSSSSSWSRFDMTSIDPWSLSPSQLCLQEKSGPDKNSKFSHDFKTLADVLIQETVRHDLGKRYPILAKNILVSWKQSWRIMTRKWCHLWSGWRNQQVYQHTWWNDPGASHGEWKRNIWAFETGKTID